MSKKGGAAGAPITAAFAEYTERYGTVGGERFAPFVRKTLAVVDCKAPSFNTERLLIRSIGTCPGLLAREVLLTREIVRARGRF